ncbi:katanin p60 ATPase-containing subunit A-like 1 [Daphnia magna]|uniref:Katanin p60 ATPase-containing subunit A1 n=1 Tax=Daphnia magna TaxID=35525 RepID=A0ABR0AXR8_9CRUS|nr:katanin p60 ATPase-containing subunit A-like 1 [Daphnia magna]KAK4029930.1 hypothetical protein OUZ56_022887 [Daphnia magna]
MALFNSFFQDFFCDPFFRTSTTSTDNVRQVAHLMDSMVLGSKAASFSFPHMAALHSSAEPRLFKKPQPQILRQGSSEDKNNSRLSEDEVWRNSLRRTSNPKSVYSLPSIYSSSPEPSKSPISSKPFNQMGINNQGKNNIRKKALNNQTVQKNGKRAGKMTKVDQRPNEELVNQITLELGCERCLVEMIERDVLQRKPNVQWTSIAGLKDAKSLLQEVVVLPNIVPDFFKGIRRPWKGVLLVGPPGTGKTLLAKAVATECKSTFFNVTSSTLTSKYRGESEKLVRILFHMARKLAPSIIFIDEVDALVAKRNAAHDHEASRRFQSELLIQMDGLIQEEENNEHNILVLAASNHPWYVDEAFRRRFEKRIYIPLPDGAAREEMLKLHLTGMKLDSRLNLSKIAKKLDGYSGADILSVCRDAAMMSLRRKIAGKSTEQIRQLTKTDLDEPITSQDFFDAVKRCKTSVSNTDMAAYDNWMKEFGSF